MLDVNQMNSLVYVQFNSKLFNKQKRIKDKNADPLVLGGDEENVEEWFAELDREGEEDELIDEDDDSAYRTEFESDDELMWLMHIQYIRLMFFCFTMLMF